MIKSILISLLVISINCMEEASDNIDESNPQFIALDSRDTIVADLTDCDSGDIFGWATYRQHDQDYGDLCDYVVTDYRPETKEQ